MTTDYTNLIISSFSAIALVHTLFLTLKFAKKSSSFLGVSGIIGLLISFAIRLSKSVLIIFFPTIPFIIPLSGLLGMFLGGVFLLLHIKQLNNEIINYTQFSFHFIPVFLLLALLFFYDDAYSVYLYYTIAVFYLAIYGLYSFYLAYSEKVINQKVQLIFIAFFAIWVSFGIQLLTDSRFVYVLITFLGSCSLYGISWFETGNKHEKNKNEKPKKTSHNQNENLIRISQKVKAAFENDKLYLDSSLTLKSLSDKLKQPTHLVSKSINNQFQKTFPQFLLSYRLDEVEKRLVTDNHLSIEAIAFDCGFNSPSNFYTVFKKKHKQTPLEFQKKYSENTLKTYRRSHSDF
ncbi:helix-turn-helix domain-containing protein [Bernardetia sp. OM2101]|uniref:helix-turn-helix domain-containing protein n=1 Tax=Bernardetia sp. OM2101 TaxID=3344876 RepID=UPI0035CF876C